MEGGGEEKFSKLSAEKYGLYLIKQNRITGFNISRGCDYLLYRDNLAIAYHMYLFGTQNLDNIQDVKEYLKREKFKYRTEFLLGYVKNKYIKKHNEYQWETEEKTKIVYEKVKGYKIEQTKQCAIVTYVENIKQLRKVAQYMLENSIWVIPDVRVAGLNALEENEYPHGYSIVNVNIKEDRQKNKLVM